MRSRACILVLLLLCVASCTVRLIGEYDEQIDKGVSDLQQQLDKFLVHVADQPSGSPPTEYAQYVDQYDNMLAKLRVLQTRAANTPKNDLTTESLRLLADNLDKLRAQHRQYGLSPDVAKASIATIDQQIGAILKLEIAKRRGKEH